MPISIKFCWVITMMVITFCSSCRSAKEFKALDLSVQIVHAIDSICADQVEYGQFPGLAIAVAQKKKRIWSKGYGYANLEKKVPVDAEDDLFRIGSISKTVTASALARLFEKGQIDLDAPISTYLQNCPEDKRDLTLRQIGGHLAGIRHYKGFEFLSNVHYENVTDPLEVFIHDTLISKPGDAYNYSTYGWTLISAAMEKSIHVPFLNIIEREVSTPLHLDDLKADHIDSTHFKRATYYEFRNGRHWLAPVIDNSNKWAGGGFICSSTDLVKYGFAHVQSDYLKEETLSIFTKSQTTSNGEMTNYGIGFSTGTDKMGRTWFGHSGGSVGGTSMLLIYPEQDLVIVTLVNLSGAAMDNLAWKIADMILSANSKSIRAIAK